MAMKYRGFQVVKRVKDEGITIKFPTRNDAGSSGYDFYFPYLEQLIINPGETKFIKTGVKVYMQSDEVFELNTRSGNGCKSNIVLANTIGWVDSSFYNSPESEGEVVFALRNEGETPFVINHKDKFGQGKFSKYFVADYDEIVNKERVGGIGSSGR